MKVSLEWMQYYSNVPLSLGTPDKLVEKIGAQLGAVEEVQSLGERYKGATVVKVIKCEKHPNADKLKICLIDDGKAVKNVKRSENGWVQVVCGAPNVAAGQLVVWLPPGATVPSSFDKDPFVLEARELRGIISNGMLASPQELAIGDSHEGLLIIEQKIRPGTAFAKAFDLDDYIVTIENKMFTHRPDCFGMLGVAREVAGIEGKAFKSPAWYKEEPKLLAGQGPAVTVKNEVPKLVTRFCALPISGVKVGLSPVWLQTYLARVGVRPINNIVDLTNYYMLLTGQPLHAYDADKLATGTLGARLSKAGEKLVVIGGKEIKLEAGAVVITDGAKPVGLGGVMGGADTEVDNSTKNIILEAATFDMNLTRKTAFSYGLFTDAATRFTKGQSPRQNLAVIAKAADDVIRIAGGKLGKLTDVKNLPKDRSVVHVPADFINERLGLSLSAIEMKRLLDNVEFSVRRDAGKLAITPPFWRTDIEIPEDIVEEIGRLHGYDHLPLVLPKRDLSAAPANSSLKLKANLRELLSRYGANEALTYSFVHSSLLEKVGQDVGLAYHIRNALSPDLQYYRLSLSPSLLEKVHPNIKAGYDEFGLFEMGVTHSNQELDEEGLPKGLKRLALVLAANEKTAKAKYQGSPYYWAESYASRLYNEFGLSVSYQTLEKAAEYGSHKTFQQMLAPFEPKRSSLIYVDGKLAGVAGEYKASVKQSLKLPNFCAGLEVFLSNFEPEPIAAYAPLNRFPPLEQDLCLKVAANISYEELTALVGEELGKLSDAQGIGGSLEPLDIYQKESDRLHKQITWRLTFWHPERTLTTTEVNKILDEVSLVAKTKLRAERI